jgi:hypothetical protein
MHSDEIATEGAVMQWKGVVHGNVVVLDKGEQLPEGVRVTVTIDQTDVMGTEDLTPDDLEQRRIWAAQIRAFGQQLTGRQVNLGDLVLEGREELEERA